MTEADWLTCTDPRTMRRAMGVVGATPRKSRLFCCGYCRCFFWDFLPPGIHKAIEIAEVYADQAVSKYKLRKARGAFHAVGTRTNAEWRANLVAQIATSTSNPFTSACMLLENRNTLPWRGGMKAITRLIREIFGYPFGPVLLAAGPILTWNNHTISKLAQAIYNERAFDRLPILADALEEAGCTNKDILNHCREPGAHVLGCWVVDLVLGKE